MACPASDLPGTDYITESLTPLLFHIMSAATEFEVANAGYVASFDNLHLTLGTPARKPIVIACMDVRIDPWAALG
jgi:hypothetical protein